MYFFYNNIFHKEQLSHRAPSRGSIIVFALSAIAAMSITAALLTTVTILEVKQSANVERAFIAMYRAESGLENSLYILNQSFNNNKTIQETKNLFGFGGSTNFAKVLDCKGADLGAGGCQTNIQSLEVKFGAQTIGFNISKDKAMTLNIFDPDDKNQPPYGVTPYTINELRISGLSGTDAEEFEVSFITWKYSPSITINPPVKRLLKDSADGVLNNVALLQFPTSSYIGEPTISELGTNNQLIGIIRIRLLTPQSLSGLTLQFFNSTGVSVCDTINGPAQCIPGFIEVISVGKDDSGLNKQAMKVVASIPTESNQASDIWDYAMFSNSSLSK